ncbi:MAG: cytochrome c biogenesis protein CcsA [Verrucomicrobiota bacterium]
MDWIFLIAATLCFLGGFLFAVGELRSDRHNPTLSNLIAHALGLGLICGFLYVRGQLHMRCPITNGAEVLVFIAWSIVIMYFVLGKGFRLSLIGTFTAPIVLILLFVAILLELKSPVVASPKEVLDPWLELHMSVCLLAYGGLALAAVAGVMYLVQNKQLKSGTPGNLSFSLPPIRMLIRSQLQLLGIGLLLLSVGIVSAFFLREKSPTTLHLVILGSVWAFYALILLIYWWKRFSPRLLSVLSVVAFAFALVTLSVL